MTDFAHQHTTTEKLSREEAEAFVCDNLDWIEAGLLEWCANPTEREDAAKLMNALRLLVGVC